MSVNVISRAGGTAIQLRSGGWLVDLGHDMPTWAPDREAALDLIDPVGHPADPPGAGPLPSRRADVAAGPSPDTGSAATQTFHGAGGVGAPVICPVGALTGCPS